MQAKKILWMPVVILALAVGWTLYSARQEAAYTPDINDTEIEQHTPPVTTTLTPNTPPASTPTPTTQPPSEEPVGDLPRSASIVVPFTAQAPNGDWDDPLQQDGCEEASLIMAKYWISGQSLTKSIALQEIYDASAWEEDHVNGALSLSVADTARLAKEYFKFTDVEVKYDITINDIKSALARGRVVIVPMNGQVIGNVYYTAPGPIEHMLLIRGYDDRTGEFITNDPGTRQGKDYRYDYATFMNGLREYPTGHHEPITTIRRAMISIGKP